MFEKVDLINICDFLLILSLLFCGTSFVVAKAKVRFEEALPVTVSAIVLSLYLCGIFEILKWGFFAINIILIGLFIAGIIIAKKDLKIFCYNFFTPGFLIYILCCFIIAIFSNYAAILHHDDINHWALAAKNTFILDAIGIGERSNVSYPDYPPATALFAYWLLKLKGVFSEHILLFSMSLWAFAILIYPLKNINWKSYKTLILSFITILSFPMSFQIGDAGEFYYMYLMVDYLLAILFGYSLFLIISSEKNISKFNFLSIILSLCCLAIVKKVGIFLGIIGLSIIAIDLIESERQISFLKTNYSFETRKKISAKLLSELALFFLPFLMVILLWKIKLELNSVDSSNVNMNFSATVSDLIKAKLHFPPRALEIVKIYLEALYKKPITSGAISLTWVSFTLLIIFGTIIFYQNSDDTKSKKRILRNSLIISIFGILFVIGHILMYLVVLSDGESFGLSSFCRYFLYYFVAASFLALNIFIYKGFKLKNISYRLLSILLMIYLCLAANFGYVISYLKRVEGSIQEKNDLMGSMPEMIKKNININNPPKGICVFEGTPGSGYGYSIILRNEFAPIKIGRYIAENPKNDEESKWAKAHFQNEMVKCSYVILIGVNEVLMKNYKQNFENSPIKQKGFYEVKIKGDKQNPKISFNLIDCSICQ